MPKKKRSRRVWIWLGAIAVVAVVAGVLIARGQREKPPEVTTQTIATKTLVS